MKKIILLYLMFLYTTNAFAADCAISASGDYIMRNWTGQCKNGMVHGEGSGINYTKAYTVGKYEVYEYGTETTGLYFEDWGSNKYIEIRIIDEEKGKKNAFERNYYLLKYECVEGCMPYVSKNSLWVLKNRGAGTQETRYPLETLLTDALRIMKRYNVDSMDSQTFKSYLLAEENKIAEAEIKKLDMIEDPPVKGIKLSLGGKTKPKKKSKK